MTRRQQVEERARDGAVNEERARIKKEAEEAILEEDAARDVLAKARDWQEDMEEKRYEAYMAKYQVQTGEQVNSSERSKEDETVDLTQKTKPAEKKKADDAAETIQKTTEADKVAQKVEKAAKPEQAKPMKGVQTDSPKPELTLKLGLNKTREADSIHAQVQKKSAPASKPSARAPRYRCPPPTCRRPAPLSCPRAWTRRTMTPLRSHYRWMNQSKKVTPTKTPKHKKATKSPKPETPQKETVTKTPKKKSPKNEEGS